MGDLEESNDDARNDNRPVVLVTGFGPFQGHPVNPAWLAVKKLAQLHLPKTVRGVFRKISVEYDHVVDRLPAWYAELRPALIIHVGVGAMHRGIEVEKQAFNGGYVRLDVAGNVPLENCCRSDAPDCMQTGIDVQKLIEDVNLELEDELKAIYPVRVSLDPGRYLCGFIYYYSLCCYSKNTLFVHVPTISDSVTPEVLAEGLRLIIIAALQQLDL